MTTADDKWPSLLRVEKIRQLGDDAVGPSVNGAQEQRVQLEVSLPEPSTPPGTPPDTNEVELPPCAEVNDSCEDQEEQTPTVKTS